MIIRALAGWVLLLILASANGAVRETWLVPRLGIGLARAVSTIMLSLLIIGAGWFLTPWMGPRTTQEALTIGIIWVLLTLAFEFIAGRFIFGRTWSELFAEYNLMAGRIWIMVLVITLLTPVVTFVRRGA